MRMTLFSGFVAQSILRWTSPMRSSVDIDLQCFRRHFVLVRHKKMNDFRDAKRWSYKKNEEREKKERKRKRQKKKNDDDDFMKSKT